MMSTDRNFLVASTQTHRPDSRSEKSAVKCFSNPNPYSSLKITRFRCVKKPISSRIVDRFEGSGLRSVLPAICVVNDVFEP